MEWPQILSYLSIGLGLLFLALLATALTKSVSKKVTKRLAWSGLALALLLSLNSGLIYFWQHFLR